ncbi:macrolide transporter subunit MacA [Enhygromyxa salina]|uniref:Macrolide transporter subunit MacA n=1 Tax=Enhygromyxa salina TaxID=215803 RepID=A0A2S9XD66_9BACT|nr:HlyD family efflux transporter periplasmic adaptor subunit [Enhygromyxa salina]PRP90621.1 macrolide transporter subunit MacA [Enhygromyxa salina]
MMARVRRALTLSRIVGLGLLGLASACSQADAADEWTTVRRDTLVVEVDVTGTLRAVDSDVLGPPGVPGVWDYKIAMMAEEGSEVSEGQPLLAFDTSDLQRRLERKIAERDSAAKQVEKTRAEVDVNRHDLALELADARAQLRKAELKADAPADIVASSELQKLRYDVELAEKRVAFLTKKGRAARQRNEATIERWLHERDRAEERVTQLSAAIDQMTVKAPRAGTVIYETSWRGQKKKVGDTAWRGETVMQVVSLTEMEARGDVDEVDASKVATGQPVSLRLDAQPDVELHGEVRSISSTVRRQSPESPLKVVRLDIVLVGGEHLRLRPGMRFRGKIEIERVEGVLLAPLEAFAATPDGPVARTPEGEVSVTLGRRNADAVEIRSGLAEGDELQREGSRR